MDAQRREVTTTRVEYVLATPCYWGEIHKLLTRLRAELGEDKAEWDDAVKVEAHDGEIVFSYPKEQP